MLNKTEQQRFLKYYYKYYSGKVDGVVGKKTKEAIKKFQKKNKLSVDGIWGKKTNAKAIALTKSFQTKLKKVGFSLGSVDGIIGTKMINAIKKFQKEYKLSLTGCLNKETESKLNSLYAKKIADEKLKSKAIFSFQNSDGSINWEDVEKLGFEKKEFKCQCGGKYCKGYPKEISIYLLNALISIRKKFGGKVLITSGLRCTKHNKNVGGVSGSKHTLGKASDIVVYDKNGKIMAQSKVKAYAKKQKNFNYSYYGTSGMGKATHIDFSK